jgi:hypothetical protein
VVLKEETRAKIKEGKKRNILIKKEEKDELKRSFLDKNE